MAPLNRGQVNPPRSAATEFGRRRATGKEARMPFTEKRDLELAARIIHCEAKLATLIAGAQDALDLLRELIEEVERDAEDGGWYCELEAHVDAKRSSMRETPSTAAERMHALACPSACPSISESMPGYLALIEEEARLGATRTSFKCWLRGDGTGEDTCAMLSGAAAEELAKTLRAEGFEAHATGMPMRDRSPFWRVDVAW